MPQAREGATYGASPSDRRRRGRRGHHRYGRLLDVIERERIHAATSRRPVWNSDGRRCAIQPRRTVIALALPATPRRTVSRRGTSRVVRCIPRHGCRWRSCGGKCIGAEPVAVPHWPSKSGQEAKPRSYAEPGLSRMVLDTDCSRSLGEIVAAIEL